MKVPASIPVILLADRSMDCFGFWQQVVGSMFHYAAIGNWQSIPVFVNVS